MLYGLYLSAAGMQAQEYRQNVTANNLANAQTTGFKRDLAMVQSRLEATHEDPGMLQYRVPVLSQQGGGVLAMPTMMDMSQGMLLATHSPTDVALKGSGFFTLQGDKTGEPFLTRDGHFAIDSEGTLVASATSRAVLGADGNPIKLANPSLPISIDDRGQLQQAGATVATLGLTDVKDPDALKKIGGNLFSVDAEAMTPADPATQVKQQFLESSGVDPVVEMTNMMQNQRAYEANAKMITYQDTTLQLINTVGRIA